MALSVAQNKSMLEAPKTGTRIKMKGGEVVSIDKLRQVYQEYLPDLHIYFLIKNNVNLSLNDLERMPAKTVDIINVLGGVKTWQM